MDTQHNQALKDRYIQVLKDPNMAGDMVNHPPHYNAGKVEVIDYILQTARHYVSDQAVLVGNVIKYVSRAPLKGTLVEDLKKARWYLDKLIDHATENGTAPKS